LAALSSGQRRGPWTRQRSTTPRQSIAAQHCGCPLQPEQLPLATLAYQRERAASEMINVGWQWPVNDLWGDKGASPGSRSGSGGRRWYSVGRMNFNMVEQRMVDSLYGFEYDGCCWIGRAVLQRTYTSRTASNTQIMFSDRVRRSFLSGQQSLRQLCGPIFRNTRTCAAHRRPEPFYQL
jgi:hypothetical protein